VLFGTVVLLRNKHMVRLSAVHMDASCTADSHTQSAPFFLFGTQRLHL
jgi:hypothetical protein